MCLNLIRRLICPVTDGETIQWSNLERADEVTLHEAVALLQLVVESSLFVEQHVQFHHLLLHRANVSLLLQSLCFLHLDLTCNVPQTVHST